MRTGVGSVIAAGGLAGGELEPDLGDVAQPPLAGRLIEPELERHVGCRKQRELLRGEPFSHTPIMNGGCDTPFGRSVDRKGGESPETDDPQVHAPVVQLVEQAGEAADDRAIGELCIGEIEVQPRSVAHFLERHNQRIE